MRVGVERGDFRFGMFEKNPTYTQQKALEQKQARFYFCCI